jgi:H+/Cl- antiporter ClcA
MHAFHRLFPVLPLEQFYLLGMAGFLTAITDAPLTAVAMIISIVVGSQHFMLPIIISSLVAARIASLFGDSVYHQQALIYIDRSRYAETR